MAHLYADENFPFPSIEELRRLGNDVQTMLDSGRAGLAIPDDEVLMFATNEGRALLTLNRKHFIRLHRLSSDHAGIIVCTFDPDYTALAHRIHEALEAQGNVARLLVRVNRPG